ncbi:MAG: alpha/beta hydrolase-fold protein [Anaerolineaceae bacterium]
MTKPPVKISLKGAFLFLTVVAGIFFVSWFASRNARSQNSDLVQTPHLVKITSSGPVSSPLNATTQPNQDLTAEAIVANLDHLKLLCADAQGKIIEDHLYSDTFETVIPLRVYFPPCGNPDIESHLSYATLYLLHGLGSDESQWVNLGLEEVMNASMMADISPFIVVMPQVPEMYIWPSDKNAIFFIDELIPYIDNRYPTLTDRAHRAIGGLSRGAAWALRIGLTHPDYFGKIGLHSLPLYDDEVTHWASVLSTMESSATPQISMDIGKNDKDLGSTVLFDQLLNSLNVLHEYNLFDGNHDEVYWSEHLPIYLEWYAQGW